MRNNQVTITIQRFGDEVPKELNKSKQTIRVYCDSNNLYEALVGAFNEAVMEIQIYQELPKHGRKERYPERLSDMKNSGIIEKYSKE